MKGWEVAEPKVRSGSFTHGNMSVIAGASGHGHRHEHDQNKKAASAITTPRSAGSVASPSKPANVCCCALICSRPEAPP